MRTALMRNIVKQLAIVLITLAVLANPRQALAEWSVTTSGALYYTDDVGIFSATRRLARDADPTQPAIDSRLTNQGSDFVFEPDLKLSNSFDSGYGVTTIDLNVDGFVFFDKTRYSHGTLLLQAEQAFTEETKLQLRYYYSPNLFLGDNEERRSGNFLIEPERVTSYIGSLRIDREVTESLEVRLLARYGTRLYNESYRQRDTNFWTVGPHLEWQIIPSVRFVLSYHYERGLAQGRHEANFEDDVS